MVEFSVANVVSHIKYVELFLTEIFGLYCPGMSADKQNENYNLEKESDILNKESY